MNKACFECDRNQMLKISQFMELDKDKENTLLQEAQAILDQCDMTKTNPEIMADIWVMVTELLKNKDPYAKIKYDYNELLLSMSESIKQEINKAEDSFDLALKLAITGNLIDFAAKHTFDETMVKKLLKDAKTTTLAIDDSATLKAQLKKAKTLLYLGDNCGEIVLDKLFIEVLKKENPSLNVYYGVRGKPIVNDVTKRDALQVKMEQVATIISNGDGSLGTVLTRTSSQFQKIFHEADLIICKGQGNYEGLLGHPKENIFFMFMAKCELVAQLLGIECLKIVCLRNKVRKNKEIK